MNKLTPQLEEIAKEKKSQFCEKCQTRGIDVSKFDQNELGYVFALSDFISSNLIRDPGILQKIEERNLTDSCLKDCFSGDLDLIFSQIETEEQLLADLRQYRTLMMICIAWQELTGRIEIQDSVATLSLLAENIILRTRDWLYNRLIIRYGTPIGGISRKPQQLIVIAMGKLGGSELNFSSDIDLIFCYPENGDTVGGRKGVENQIFFTKLAQQLINALHMTTVDGQVYRIDMRLRPFGEDGSLVVNFTAMEDYYQKHGRSWERYAMVKARVLGEQTEDVAELYSMLRPFVYRRYFDFGAIDSLRKMKSMIETEVRRRGLINNIKLGMGGIREVEFVTQVFQLIRGGREPELQIRNLPLALERLEQEQIISSESKELLLKGYLFLRKVENILQEINDQQTQMLPESSVDQDRLVTVLGYKDWNSFLEVLHQHLQNIHGEFKVVVQDQDVDDNLVDQVWNYLWNSNLSVEEIAGILEESGGSSNPDFAAQILSFKRECMKKIVGPQGRETINLLMPRVLEAVMSYEEPEKLFERVSQLIKTISTRTTYMQLLYEKRNVLDQVLHLCNASEKIADQFCLYPILLDELIFPDSLYHITTDPHQLRSELRQSLLRVPGDDLEQQMEVLRQFKQIQLLKISAADIVGQLTLMKVSDFLTELAEAIIAEVTSIAWQEMVAKYGVPPYSEQNGGMGLVIVAYGKLGGIELAYGSDLDLVFLHYNCEPDETTVNGPKSISIRQFYIRLIQRIIHLFNIRTSSGILYEIDVRLRPDGDSGLLVSSLNAFESYQKNEAWTWEHQALVRARPIFGDQSLIDDFSRIRREVLQVKRDPDKLRHDVIEMRHKMREHLIKAGDNEFDLKQGNGGMVDIEFLAQYLVLSNAYKYPEILTRWSDNVRIIESCVDCQLISPEDACKLKQAYLNIRDKAHHRSLRGQERTVSNQHLGDERNFVIDFWNKTMGADLF